MTPLTAIGASTAIAMPVPTDAQRYRYAGGTIASTLPLPELPAAAPGQDATQLCIVQRSHPVYPPDSDITRRHTWTDSDGTPAILGARAGDRYGLRFPDIAEACIGSNGDIDFWPDPQSGLDSARHVLLDHVLPRALSRKGRLVLHGSCVITPHGDTLVILGESGFGKSTLAAGFDLHNNGTALTDDCVMIDFADGQPLVHPCYPGLRLWPDSFEALLQHRHADATQMADYSDKQRIPPSVLTDLGETHRLDAILVLQPPGQAGATRFRPLSTHRACMDLMTNSFQLDPGDMRHAHRLLAVAARLAGLAPIHAMYHPRDYASLHGVVLETSQYIRAITGP